MFSCQQYVLIVQEINFKATRDHVCCSSCVSPTQEYMHTQEHTHTHPHSIACTQHCTHTHIYCIPVHNIIWMICRSINQSIKISVTSHNSNNTLTVCVNHMQSEIGINDLLRHAEYYARPVGSIVFRGLVLWFGDHCPDNTSSFFVPF